MKENIIESIEEVKEKIQLNGDLFNKITEEMLEDLGITSISLIGEAGFNARMFIKHSNGHEESIMGSDNMIAALEDIIGLDD